MTTPSSDQDHVVAWVDTPPDLRDSAFESLLRLQVDALQQALIKQTLDDIASWRLAVDIQWQAAHPGQHMSSPIPHEEIERYADTVRTSYYAWIQPTFERYLRPALAPLDAAADAMRRVAGMFGNSAASADGSVPASDVQSKIDDVRADMQHWRGRLQENFLDSFVDPLEKVTTNQGLIAFAVQQQLLRSKIVYLRIRRAVLDLLGKSITAVDAVPQQHDGSGVVTWSMVALTVAGAALPLIDGLEIVGVGVGAIGAIGGSLAADGGSTGTASTLLSAPTAQEVANNIMTALSRIEDDLSHAEIDLGPPTHPGIKQSFDSIRKTLEVQRTVELHTNVGPDKRKLTVPPPAVDAVPASTITNGSLRPDR